MIDSNLQEFIGIVIGDEILLIIARKIADMRFSSIHNLAFKPHLRSFFVISTPLIVDSDGLGFYQVPGT
jgi:hypothetical protein